MGKILWVEDDEQIREVVRNTLEGAGYSDLVTAKDGIEAIEKLSGGRPNLVITDIAMPRMDGCDLIKAIRGSDSRVPIIVVTGFPDLVNRALALGACSSIPKPLEYEKLLDHIVQYLDV